MEFASIYNGPNGQSDQKQKSQSAGERKEAQLLPHGQKCLLFSRRMVYPD
jgi:hypothetical protein